MPIAPFHFYAAPGEVNRAPAGGCWIAGTNASSGTIPGFPPASLPGTVPTATVRPALFYPEGYWLPAGTVQYAVMYSATNLGRVTQFRPWEYQSEVVAGLRAIQDANAARVPELLALGILQPDEVDNYIATRGLTAADLRRLAREDDFGLIPGEVYIGRPVIVLFNVGTPAAARRQMVQALLDDIENALDGSP